MADLAACPDPERLRRYLLGQLSALESEELEQHLPMCSICLETAQTLQGEDHLIAAMRRGADLARTPLSAAAQDLLHRLQADLKARRGFRDAPVDAARTAPYAKGPALANGTSFGDYEVLEELGRGGMGVVYKTRHVKFQRLVALKMILAGTHASADQEARFLAEARAVARLQHANIVQIHEIGTHEGRPYFSLEYVDGGSLAAQLKGPPPSDQEAALLLEVLARATDYAHSRGIVHRDLKPANVLLSRDGVPKIADFGLAKFLDEERGPTRTGAVLGTPSYMAPEQATGRGKEIGPGTDVYALGAILYELLTGRPPFRAESDLQTLHLVVEHTPERPRVHNPRVDPSLEAICLKCLEKRPADRYASAAALADELAAYLRGESVLADRGTGTRLLRAVMRESRYTEIMTLWSAVWMGMAVLNFVLNGVKALLLWKGVTDYAPFFGIWIVGHLGTLALVWWFRLRRGPRLSHVEWQLVQIWAMFWIAFLLTAWVYARTGGPIVSLLQILTLQAVVAFAAMATILGGSFNIIALIGVGLLILESLWPDAAALFSAVGVSPLLFWLGWKYSRRLPAG